MIWNAPDIPSFKRKLGTGFYQRWKGELGSRAWSLLEAETGRLVV